MQSSLAQGLNQVQQVRGRRRMYSESQAEKIRKRSGSFSVSNTERTRSHSRKRQVSEHIPSLKDRIRSASQPRTRYYSENYGYNYYEDYYYDDYNYQCYDYDYRSRPPPKPKMKQGKDPKFDDKLNKQRRVSGGDAKHKIRRTSSSGKVKFANNGPKSGSNKPPLKTQTSIDKSKTKTTPTSQCKTPPAKEAIDTQPDPDNTRTLPSSQPEPVDSSCQCSENKPQDTSAGSDSQSWADQCEEAEQSSSTQGADPPDKNPAAAPSPPTTSSSA